jgi:outer membrane autotransporter protein
MVNSLNLQHRMDDIRWGSTGFCADGFVIQDNHGYTKNDGKSVADKNPAVEQTAPPDYRWGAFITGTGELAKVGEEGDNADGYQINQAGFTLGVDYRLTDHWAIGLSGGYSHSTAELVDNGRMNTDGGKMGLYTTYYTNGFYVDAAASGGWNQFDTRRTAFLGQETGSTDGAEFDGMVAVGYDWKKGCWTFGPTASFEYTYAEFNSFTESNTSLIPLHYGDQNQDAYRSNLGFRIAHEQVMKPGEGLTVVPELRASWRHDFGSSAYAIDSNFVGCDDTFTVHGPWIGRDSAVVDLGLTAYCTPGLSAYIFYDGQFGRDNYNNNAISGGFRVAF